MASNGRGTVHFTARVDWVKSLSIELVNPKFFLRKPSVSVLLNWTRSEAIHILERLQFAISASWCVYDSRFSLKIMSISGYAGFDLAFSPWLSVTSTPLSSHTTASQQAETH
jgi:hypothetical protein